MARGDRSCLSRLSKLGLKPVTRDWDSGEHTGQGPWGALTQVRRIYTCQMKRNEKLSNYYQKVLSVNLSPTEDGDRPPDTSVTQIEPGGLRKHCSMKLSRILRFAITLLICSPVSVTAQAREKVQFRISGKTVVFIKI